MNNKMKQSFQNLYSAAQKGFNGLKGLWNDWTGNTQIDKQLEAQQKENAEMRDYNLKLAKMQNEWNIAQWERENAYNSPSAQKARLEAAGLNADMMYGQGGVVNTSSPSPSLSAGAPANPMDWSSLANKKSVGQAIMDNLAIEQARANVRKTNAEADITSSDADIRPRLNSLGLSKLEVDTDVANELANLYNSQRNNVDLQTDLEHWKKQMRVKFGEQYVSSKIKEISKNADIAEKQLQFEIETLAQRIIGTNAENTPLINIQNLSNQNLRLVLEVLKTIMK